MTLPSAEDPMASQGPLDGRVSVVGGRATLNREVLERVLFWAFMYSWELQLRWRIRRPTRRILPTALKPREMPSLKVAIHGPFEAVLGKPADGILEGRKRQSPVSLIEPAGRPFPT